jgi:hypothetical protein
MAISFNDFNMNRKIVTSIDLMSNGIHVRFTTVEGKPMFVHINHINVYDTPEIEKIALYHPQMCKNFNPFYIGDEFNTLWMPKEGTIKHSEAFRLVMNGYIIDFVNKV